VAGYRARAARIGLSVDNFFTEKNFNDFNSRCAKSLKMLIFDHYEFLGTMEFDGDQFKLQWLS
jgi:hypothetical protein